MKRQIVILAAILAVAGGVSAQSIRRPPMVEVCPDPESVYCQMWPYACVCTTTEMQVERIAPSGAPYDPFAGTYLLPKTIGVTQLAFEPEPVGRRATSHMTAYELLDEVAPLGFGALKIWLDAVPFDGMGEWCFSTYYGAEHCADFTTEGLELERFWRSVPDGMAIFLRPQSIAWTWFHENPCIDGDGAGPQMALADYYAISKRLFELIGDHNIQVILTDWEQDWISCHEESGGQPFLRRIIEQRQRDVERARREAYLERGYRPKLEIYHAVIVNKFPVNAPDWPYPYLAEVIPTLEHRPDFIGLSYWSKGSDPRVTLDWIRDVTGYPPHRIYIDEFGADEDRQAERFAEYIPAFWEWGVRVVNIWMWRQTWCDERCNLGLWKQVQPCAGKVAWGDPTDGYYVIRELNEGR
jgi:hypothetical protein